LQNNINLIKNSKFIKKGKGDETNDGRRKICRVGEHGAEIRQKEIQGVQPPEQKPPKHTSDCVLSEQGTHHVQKHQTKDFVCEIRNTPVAGAVEVDQRVYGSVWAPNIGFVVDAECNPIQVEQKVQALR
jgi:hypothetical protein